MKKYKFISIGIIFIGLITGIFATVSGEQPTPRTITLADASHAGLALIYIAEKQGFFTDEGLTVQYRKHALGRDALHDMLQGNADLATAFETPVVKSTYEGKLLRIISTLHSSSYNTALVARKDHGIESPVDLHGKRIAVTRGTNTEGFIFAYLTSEGIKIPDVTLIDALPSEMDSLLRNEQVDAIVVYNPHLYIIRDGDLKNKIVVFQSDIFIETSVLAARPEFVAENPEAAKGLLRALLRAEDYAKSHQEESISIAAETLGQSTESLTQIWDSLDLHITLDNVLISVLEREAKWYRDLNIYSVPPPDFHAIIETSPLRSVRPDTVTVL